MSYADNQYMKLVEKVLETGEDRLDRTGVGARSIFGEVIRFDLSDGTIPILTTKRVYWKTAFKEMLWFLTGKTNLRDLLQENVRIWSDWPLEKYRRETGNLIDQDTFEKRILDEHLFAEKWGDLGPIYGKQWRRWLGSDGREYDQIQALIEGIKASPSSRRLLFHGWNVAELDVMALPPCHMVYQFHVNLRMNRLSCLLFQRSADVAAGVPFNWASASQLTHMIAQQCGLSVGELVWMAGDVHVYSNHVAPLQEQMARVPRNAPHFRLTREVPSIDDYRIEDFAIDGYDPHPPIRLPIAV